MAPSYTDAQHRAKEPLSVGSPLHTSPVKYAYKLLTADTKLCTLAVNASLLGPMYKSKLSKYSAFCIILSPCSSLIAGTVGKKKYPSNCFLEEMAKKPPMHCPWWCCCC